MSFLEAYLAPLGPLLADASVQEIAINPDGRVWIERRGAVAMEEVMGLAPEAALLAAQIAGAAGLPLGPRSPLVAASLARGGVPLRVQILVPPAIASGAALSFRKFPENAYALADYPVLATPGPGRGSARAEARAAMAPLIAAGELHEALRLAVAARLTLLLSGGTSTAKTGLARALIALIDPAERLVTIEDAAELHLAHPNRVALLAGSPDGPRSAAALLGAALRLRPDRIILGEVRGAEAWSFLEAINTGHPGSLTTIHADSPERAIARLVMLVIGAGIALPEPVLVAHVRASIDAVVQLDRLDGRRGIAAMALTGTG